MITRPQSATARNIRDGDHKSAASWSSPKDCGRSSNQDDLHLFLRDRVNSQSTFNQFKLTISVDTPDVLASFSVRESSRNRSIPGRGAVDPVTRGRVDPFDEAMEEYIDTVRVAGHQAMTLAKNKIQNELKTKFDEESRRIRQELVDRDRVISSLQHEIDTRKDSWVRISKQLRHMADLLGKRGSGSLLQLCRARTDQEVVKAIIDLWIRKANDLRKDRVGTAFVTNSYNSKLILRVYSAWRISSITQSVARSAATRLDALETSKEATIDRLTKERDKARAEIERLGAELDEERSLKDDSLKNIESLLANKFKDFTQEISRLGHKRKPTASSIDSSS